MADLGSGPNDRTNTRFSNPLPSLSLPKGGGAIRGLGEKFAANLVTGTGSMSVPIPTSPARSGFGPQLSLSYDSGSGNGPFGFGWSLSLPAITRKTDKGLPQYRDAEESDVFILSGSEDLVPVLEPDGTRFKDTGTPGYVIHRYRPRTEGLFGRIERWTKAATGEIHWRSITRDNTTTLYGKDNNSRIGDPAPSSLANPTDVFSWLICESYDDKGNAVVYEYAEESDHKVDLGQANERNRVRTANRYVKRIKYGNRDSRLIQPDLNQASWMFEVVFDYDEGHFEDVDLDPARPEAEQHRFARVSASVGHSWAVRPDPFSSYRAGFEVRSYRRCRRVLMFHHIPDVSQDEKGYDGLVRSTEFDYADLDYQQPVAIDDELAHQGSTRFASFIRSVTQSGFVRDDTQPVVVRNGVPYVTHLKKSLPPLEFEYSKAEIQEEVRELDAASLENLPAGLDGTTYQWVDLDGEGVSGILTEQAGGWFYKPNLGEGRFGPVKTVAAMPSLANLSSGRQQLLDLAGDGQLDLVALNGPTPGFYERTHDEDWEPFEAFRQIPNIPWDEPNLRFIDLDGDGHADVLITEQDVFTWHASLAEEGFAPAQTVRQALDEERGPRLVLADGTQSIYLADMCGDGLTDLVRIRNSEVCYWPNLGYGVFGARVTMDNAPWFDNPDQFDQRRVRLADIDGSGTNDIIYLGRDDVRLYFNQSGNRLSEARRLGPFPRVDSLSSVQAVDLQGNGTACLVWSSALPGEARRPVRYMDLMGGQKPHLLVKTVNNLGAETVVQYAPSTRFYLADKRSGKPWITRLPFPVHVVERVETRDLISRNRFVTRYAYHHGYFDGIEREFRGFGLVEQFDTEELAALTDSGDFPDAVNIDAASYVPTVLTRTWFHTGAYIEGSRISRHFEDEYYQEGDESEGVSGLTAEQLQAMLLPDSVLPTTLKHQDGSSIPWDLTAEEIQEACRALRGSVLRREVYALDGTDEEDRPYTATEQNYTIELLQPKADNRHAVFFTHPRESIDFQYERKLIEVGGKKMADPRVKHAMTLEVDGYGNVLKSVAIGYGRRPGLSALEGGDKDKQEQLRIVYTENDVTYPVDQPNDYRGPMTCEARTFELLKLLPDRDLPDITNLFRFDEMASKASQAGDGLHDLPYEDVSASGATTSHPYRRLIEQVRTLYRRNDLAGPLPLGHLDSLAIPFESYKLALTPTLVTAVYGAKVTDGMLADHGRYVHSGDANWWIPSGKVFFHIDPDIENPSSTAPQELTEARAHFFLPRKFVDPFDQSATVDYDPHDLSVIKTEDALSNRLTARIDYRVLQPSLVTDPNGNRAEVAFDALGMMTGTAVMGKASETLGDSLDSSIADPTRAQSDAFIASPRLASANAEESVPSPIARYLLGNATTRVIYDLDRFRRSGEPPVTATIVRETHVHDPAANQLSKIQIGFSYSDGFGREIQKKIQAEPGPVEEGGPVVSPRWVGSGWTVFNNKGKPVRQYEPFFDDTHDFKFGLAEGVSPVLFYDPVERVVATLHPNHTYEKVVFDTWEQTTYDVNDTVTFDPQTDDDVSQFSRLPEADYLPSWHVLRTDPAHAAEAGLKWPDPKTRAAEKKAAAKAAKHANTPSVTHFDSLFRPFLTIVQNKFDRRKPDDTIETIEENYPTRLNLDIEGNQREVTDANDRLVMRYDYDMLGNQVHQVSMEAGGRWMLGDVAGGTLYAWDSRGHTSRTEYDELRRPVRVFVTGADPANPNEELLTERLVYGEQHPEAEERNLRGKLYLHLDQAGASTSEAHDFKGNLLRTARRIAEEYKQAIDWSAVDAVLPADGAAKFIPSAVETVLAPLVEADPFTAQTTYDALNRPTSVTAPDNSVYRPTFNEANLLEKVDVNLRGAPSATPFVTDIDYNAKRQRVLIEYGNNTETEYEYDAVTFRLARLKTARQTDQAKLQDLSYTFDPAGNIVEIRDGAQQPIYFNNQVAAPDNVYTYDATYRLIEAEGREHIGQLTQPETNWNDEFRVNRPHPHNGQSMRNYTDQYHYDAVGNFEQLIHQSSNGNWTRACGYNEVSLLQPGKTSNRLSTTTVGQTTEHYGYDAHGNMTTMPHLPLMQWDYRDQLQATSRQVAIDGTTEITWYVYDAAGQRARKVTERDNGTRKDERAYIGGFEVYREYESNGTSVKLERETLHVMDDTQRIALVETKTHDSSSPLTSHPSLIRYQLGNHLGSSILELDDDAEIVSYEEYYPYGSTSYQAVPAQTEAPKRYRFTGMERDEETGLSYHFRRYYSPWLCRWVSSDPIGISDEVNTYSYGLNRPTVLRDPEGTDSRLHEIGVCRKDDPPLPSRPTYIGPGTVVNTPVGPVKLPDTYQPPQTMAPRDPRTRIEPSVYQQFQANTATNQKINLLTVPFVLTLEAFGRDSRNFLEQSAPVVDAALAFGGALAMGNSQPVLPPPSRPAVTTPQKSLESGTIVGPRNKFRPRSPAVEQTTDYTCAAASCGMVLKDLGWSGLTEARIAAVLNTTPKGASILDVPHALRRMGIPIGGRNLITSVATNDAATLEHIEGALHKGNRVIASIRKGFARHAVVVDTITEQTVTFRDPAIGATTSVSREDFGSKFTGRMVQFVLKKK